MRSAISFVLGSLVVYLVVLFHKEDKNDPFVYERVVREVGPLETVGDKAQSITFSVSFDRQVPNAPSTLLFHTKDLPHTIQLNRVHEDNDHLLNEGEPTFHLQGQIRRRKVVVSGWPSELTNKTVTVYSHLDELPTKIE